MYLKCGLKQMWVILALVAWKSWKIQAQLNGDLDFCMQMNAGKFYTSARKKDGT